MLITGNLTFELDGRIFEFKKCEISETGITDLPWKDLKSDAHLGKITQMEIEVLLNEPIYLKVQGQILRELTSRNTFLMIKFIWPENKIEVFRSLIKQHGHPPDRKVRVLPRIVGNDKLKNYPKNIFLYKASGTPEQPEFNIIGTPIVTEVQDINPYGALVLTENQQSLKFNIGHGLIIVIEPRGASSNPVRIYAEIVRIIDDFAIENGNPLRKLAFKFAKVHPLDLQHFKKLMTAIIEEIQKIHSS